MCLGVLAVLALASMSCGGRRHDVAYYEAMVDSIRKAEQVKEVQQKAGIAVSGNPVEAWFDTLGIHTLPVKSAGRELWQIGHFTQVPMAINEYFGYPVSAKLRALALPSAWHRPVIMLAEMADSVNPKLYLYTMDKKHYPIDHLCLYEQQDEDRLEDFGHTYMEYYITSRYEITLMLYYQSHDEEKKAELMNTRRYIINRDGKFEETIIEL